MLVGQAELRRLGGTRLADLEDGVKGELQAALGETTFQQHAEAGPISGLPADVRDAVAAGLGSTLLTEFHRRLLLSVGDRLWIEYLTQMEALRTAIGLEAYGQRDPLVQYKSRAVDMFRGLLSSIRSGVVSRMFRVQVAAPQRAQPPPRPERKPQGAADEAQPQRKKKRRRRRGKKRR